MADAGLYINLQNDKELENALKRFTRLAEGLDDAFESVAKSIRRFDEQTVKKTADNMDKLVNAVNKIDPVAVQRLRNVAMYMQQIANADVNVAQINNMANAYNRLSRAQQAAHGNTNIASKVNVGRANFRNINRTGQQLRQLQRQLQSVFSFFTRGISSIASAGAQFLRLGYKLGTQVIKGLQQATTRGMSVFARSLSFTFNDVLRKSLIGGVRSVATSIQQELVTMGRNFNNQALNLIQRGFYTTLSGGLAGRFLGQFGGQTANFNKLLAQIGVYGDLDNNQLATMRQFIEGFSVQSVFNSQEIGEAALTLLKSGVPVEAIETIIPYIYSFAVAGDMSLDEAAESGIQIANAYGLPLTELDSIVDSVIGAADISVASPQSILHAQSFAGQSAQSLNISLDEMNAAFAQLSDQGVPQGRAGRGMRSLLDALIDPSDEATKILQRMGVELVDLEGNFKPMNEVLAEFNEAITDMRAQGMGEAEISSMLSALGPRNAITTLFALIRENEEGGLLFNDYVERLGTATSSLDVATAVIDNFWGASRRLRSAITTLINRALTPLQEDVLRPLYEVLINVVTVMSNLPAPVLSASLAFVALGGAMVTLLGFTQLLSGFLLFSLAPIFSLLGALVTTFLNPLSALFTSAVFLGGLTTAASVLATIGSLLVPIGIGIGFLFNDFNNDVAKLKSNLTFLFNSVGKLFDAIFDLGGSLLSLFGILDTDIIESGSSMEAVFMGVSNVIGSVATAIDKMAESVRNASNFIRDIISITSEWQSSLEGIIGIFNGELSVASDNPIFGNAMETEGTITVASTYTVEAGDTLTAIAYELGIPLQTLIDLNAENIADPNLIFVGQEIFTGEQAAQGIDVLGAFEHSINAVNNELSTAERLTQNPIFVRLFGDVSEQEGVMLFLEDTTMLLSRANKAISLVGRGVAQAFGGNFLLGIETMTTGFSRVALAALQFGELLFGFELSDTVEDAFYRGDLATIIESIFDVIKDTVMDNAESVANTAATAVELFIRGVVLGVPRLIANIFDITAFDPIFNLIDRVAADAGNIIRSGISLGFSILSGEESINISENPVINSAENLAAEISELTSGDEFGVFVKEIGDLGNNLFNITKSLAALGAEGVLLGLSALVDLLRDSLPKGNSNLAALNDTLENISSNLEGMTLDDLVSEIERLFPENLDLTTLTSGYTGFFDKIDELSQNENVATLVTNLSDLANTLFRLLAPALVGLFYAFGQALNIVGGYWLWWADNILPVVNPLLETLNDQLSSLADQIEETDWELMGEQFSGFFIIIEIAALGLQKLFYDTVIATVRFFADMIAATVGGLNQLDQITGGALGDITGLEFGEFDAETFTNSLLGESFMSDAAAANLAFDLRVRATPDPDVFIENPELFTQGVQDQLLSQLRVARDAGDTDAANELLDIIWSGFGTLDFSNADIFSIRDNLSVPASSGEFNVDNINAIADILNITPEDALLIADGFGAGVFDGMVEGLNDQQSLDELAAAAETITNTITGTIYSNLGIESPSTVMIQTGSDIVAGLRIGLQNTMSSLDPMIALIVNKFRQMANDISIATNSASNSIAGLANYSPTATASTTGAAAAALGGLPQFASGGYTGMGNPGGFLAVLHDDEFVIPSRQTIQQRPDLAQSAMMNSVNNGRFGGGGNSSSTNISYGDVYINIPEGTAVPTPEVIAAGMALHNKQNPPRQRTRNFF